MASTRRATVVVATLVAATQVGCGPVLMSDIRTSPDFRPSLQSSMDKVGRNHATDTRLPPMRDWEPPVFAPRRDPWRISAAPGNDALAMTLGTTLAAGSRALSSGLTARGAAVSLGYGAVVGGLFQLRVFGAQDVPELLPGAPPSTFGISR